METSEHMPTSNNTRLDLFEVTLLFDSAQTRCLQQQRATLAAIANCVHGCGECSAKCSRSVREDRQISHQMGAMSSPLDNEEHVGEENVGNQSDQRDVSHSDLRGERYERWMPRQGFPGDALVMRGGEGRAFFQSGITSRI